MSVEPKTAVDERTRYGCACHSIDARACALSRYACDEGDDYVCQCVCHQADEDERIPVSIEQKPIPIAAAARIAKEFGYDQIVIVGRRVGGFEHCTTYGIDPANCSVAARIGDFFKYELMKWERK